MKEQIEIIESPEQDLSIVWIAIPIYLIYNLVIMVVILGGI